MTTPTLPRPTTTPWLDAHLDQFGSDADCPTIEGELFDALVAAAEWAEELPTDPGCYGCGDPMRPEYGAPCRCDLADDTYGEVLGLQSQLGHVVRRVDATALRGDAVDLFYRVLRVREAIDAIGFATVAADLPAIREEVLVWS